MLITRDVIKCNIILHFFVQSCIGSGDATTCSENGFVENIEKLAIKLLDQCKTQFQQLSETKGKMSSLNSLIEIDLQENVQRVVEFIQKTIGLDNKLSFDRSVSTLISFLLLLLALLQSK